MRKLIILATAFLLCFSPFLAFAYSQATYTIIVKVDDSEGLPVSGASVRVTTKYGPEDYRDAAFPPYCTNASGIVVYENVYSVDGLAHMVVSKGGIELASGDYTLTLPRTNILIVCQNLATLTVYAKDSGSQPLKNALVRLKWQSLDGLQWDASQTSDQQGKAAFPQMSYWTYQVEVLWQGLTVHQGIFSFSASNRNYNAICKVHNLTVNVFDAANKPLTNAKVTITRGGWYNTKYTSAGTVVFPQLPEANYTIQTQYEIYTNTTTVNLSSTKTVTVKLNFITALTCNVAIKAVWSDNKPITNAEVKVKNSEGYTVYSGATNATGYCLIQLLEGTYTFTVSKGPATQTKTATITSQTTVTITIDAAHRISTVKIEIYKDNTYASNVFIEIYKDGQLLNTALAPNGIATLNLPDGTYRIIAKLQDQEIEKTVTVNQDMTVPINFRTTMNPTLIYASVAFTALAIITIAVIIKLKRKAESKPTKIILQ